MRPDGPRWQCARSGTGFWAETAAGESSGAAAVTVGLSPAVSVHWFREAGGIAPSHLAVSAPTPSSRYLSSLEREELAILRAKGTGICEIPLRMGKAPFWCGRRPSREAWVRVGVAVGACHDVERLVGIFVHSMKAFAEEAPADMREVDQPA